MKIENDTQRDEMERRTYMYEYGKNNSADKL